MIETNRLAQHRYRCAPHVSSHHSPYGTTGRASTTSISISTPHSILSTSRCRIGNTSSGFTLIEVVIALAIFAGAAVVLSQAFTNALLAREHGVSNDNYEADIRTVRMQLLLEPNREEAEDGGDIPTYKNGEATWQAAIEPTNVVDLFRVELQVQFSEPEEGQDPAYTETLYLLRPTWSEADERSDLLAEKQEDLERNRDF